MRQGRVGGGGGASATSGGFADDVVHPSVEDLGTFWSFEYVRGVLRTVRVGKQGKPVSFHRTVRLPTRGDGGATGKALIPTRLGVFISIS